MYLKKILNIGLIIFFIPCLTLAFSQDIANLEKMAKQGDLDAQYDLGHCYENGIGVAKDTKKAVYWYTKAADKGLANAQDRLGYCYNYGRGVAKDLNKAFEYYSKAANQGHAKAQSNLGTFYRYGEGIEKNLDKAIYWYKKAADQGYQPAKKFLSELESSNNNTGEFDRGTVINNNNDNNSYSANLSKIFELSSLEKESDGFYNTLISNEKAGIKTTVPYLMSILAENPLGNAIDMDETPEKNGVIGTATEVISGYMVVLYFLGDYQNKTNNFNIYSNEMIHLANSIKYIYTSLHENKIINCNQKKFFEEFDTSFNLLSNDYYSKKFRNLLLKNINRDQSNNSNLYGPKIYGLQLGMSYKESKPIINDICTKHGNPFMKCEDLSGVGEAFGAPKNIRIFGDLSTVGTWDNDILVGYTLPLTIFNYNNTIDKRAFLEKLASSYNLNFYCDDKGICKGSNNDEGYQTTINLNNGYIKIEQASKLSDLEFK